MNTAKGLRVHPAQLKQLGRLANEATLGAYLEESEVLTDNALDDVLSTVAYETCLRLVRGTMRRARVAVIIQAGPITSAHIACHVPRADWCRNIGPAQAGNREGGVPRWLSRTCNCRM